MGRNGADWSGAECNGAEWSEDTIPLFGNFRTGQGILFIQPKTEGKEYGGK